MKKRCWIFRAKRLVFKTNNEDRLPRSEKSTGVTGRAVPEKKITRIAEWNLKLKLGLVYSESQNAVGLSWFD